MKIMFIGGGNMTTALIKELAGRYIAERAHVVQSTVQSQLFDS